MAGAVTDAQRMLDDAGEELKGIVKELKAAQKEHQDAKQNWEAESDEGKKAKLWELVAEAKVGVAEAKAGVAKAEWEAESEEGKKAKRWELVTKVEVGIDLAREGVKTARAALHMVSNAAAATPGGGGVAAGAAGAAGGTGGVIQALETLTMETRKLGEEQRKLPNQIVTKLKEPATKKGSSCTSGDWQAFCFDAAGSLQIPSLDDTALTMYQTVFDSTEKHVFSPASEVKLSISEALAQLDLKKENPNVHVSTRVFVEECLKARESRSLKLDSEIGYFSEKWGKYGFGDKAAFSFASADTPSKYHPCPTNVSKGFWSPVLLVGAIEEKALDVKLGNAAMAELASEMAGYVEAASKVHCIMFASFPGMLISVHDVQGRKQFFGRCVQWCLEKGVERRLVSSDLVDFKQFCAGLEWWFRECEALLAAAQDFLKQRPMRPVLLVLQEATDTGGEHSTSNDDGSDDEEVHVDEADSLEQKAQAPIPIQGTLSADVLCEKKLESLQHSQLIQNSHKASSSLQYWLSSTISVAQCHQKDPAMLLPYRSNDPV